MTRPGTWRRLLAPIQARYGPRSRQFVIFGHRLAGPPADHRLDDIAFRLATASDLERLDELEPYNRGSRQRADVEQEQDWLFVAGGGGGGGAPPPDRSGGGGLRVYSGVEREPPQGWGAAHI